MVKFNRGLRSAQENRRRCKVRKVISARQKQKAGPEVMPLIEVMAPKARDFCQARAGQSRQPWRGIEFFPAIWRRRA